MANQDFEFLKKIDLYELFDVLPEASDSEIKKAYRKKALKYHPDKNPDNAQAKEIFQQLAKALEVLTDAKARASYDNILKAKREREARYRQLDTKRRKLKTQLDERERQAQDAADIDAAEKLKQEIERIRKQGSKQLEEQNILLRQELARKSSSAIANRIKVKRTQKFVVTEDLIRTHFAKFGKILFVAVGKNNKTAVIEFQHAQSIDRVASACPSMFSFEILSVNKQESAEGDKNIPSTSDSSTEATATMEPTAKPSIDTNFADYEDYILKKLQQKSKPKESVS